MLDGISNSYTKRNYETTFIKFKKRLYSQEALREPHSCNDLLKLDPRETEDLLVVYFKMLEKERAAIRQALAAIKKFYLENRSLSLLNWNWLKFRIPKNQGHVQDKDYIHEQLQWMLSYCDIRKRAIFLILMKPREQK